MQTTPAEVYKTSCLTHKHRASNAHPVRCAEVHAEMHHDAQQQAELQVREGGQHCPGGAAFGTNLAGPRCLLATRCRRLSAAHTYIARTRAAFVSPVVPQVRLSTPEACASAWCTRDGATTGTPRQHAFSHLNIAIHDSCDMLVYV